MNSQKTEIIKSYLNQYPNIANLTLAKKVYSENNLMFKNVEEIRTVIRHCKGNHGKVALQGLQDEKYLSEQKLAEKYNLPIPSEQKEYLPFKIISNKTLIFGDVHIPFHDLTAMNTMFDFTINKNIDTIIINGDFTDCYQGSDFKKEPTRDQLNEERDMAIQILLTIKKIYPKAKIYYKFGNHEKRFIEILKTKAPMLFGFEEIRWDVLLDLFNMGIQYIPEENYIQLNRDIFIIHGHEYRNAITSPASPARTTFLRTNAISITNHWHRTTEHTKPKINGDMITSWSVACLCNLHPEWRPLNEWNLGFLLHTREDDKFFHVENKKIIHGRVV